MAAAAAAQTAAAAAAQMAAAAAAQAAAAAAAAAIPVACKAEFSVWGAERQDASTAKARQPKQSKGDKNKQEGDKNN